MNNKISIFDCINRTNETKLGNNVEYQIYNNKYLNNPIVSWFFGSNSLQQTTYILYVCLQ